MRYSITQSALCMALLVCPAMAQVLNIPAGSSGKFTGGPITLGPLQAAQMNSNIFTINGQNPNNTPLAGPSGSVSMLDLKAPGKAKREYDKGYQFLMKKDAQSAIDHLKLATKIYPKYVSAHNALGTAYLNLNQNE